MATNQSTRRRFDFTTEVCGIPIDSITLDGAADLICATAKRRTQGGYVVTPNAQHVALYHRDKMFRQAYDDAFLVVPDGVPLLWAARLAGTPLAGRVNGTDLFERIAARAAQDGLGLFCVGGRPGAAAAAVAILQKRHPGLRVCGIYDGPVPPSGGEGDAHMCQLLEKSGAHIVLVGLGAPKQEVWMWANAPYVSQCVMVGIGGSFELVAGFTPRAPTFMQRMGMEWFFRLMMEPKRLLRRYIYTNTLFLAHMFSSVTRRRRKRAAARQ